MKTRLFGLIAVSTLLFSTVAFSHHSFAGTYVMDQSRTIQGTVVDFTIRNPHSFLLVEVQDTAGNTKKWGIEWSGITALRDAGINVASLKIGEKVAITGALSRDPQEAKLLMQKIVRSNNELVWEGVVGRRTAPTVP